MEKLGEGETRNQIDVVIHNKRYPRLPLAAGIDLFFIETVSSTIEIKSRLTKEDVRNAAAVAKRIKSLARFDPQRFNPTGMVKKSTSLFIHLCLRRACKD